MAGVEALICGFPVSIPAWFDWRCAAPLPPAPAGRRFNPSLVRLARPRKVGKSHKCELFQSQLGSIGALLRPAHQARPAPFQSQLGSIGADTRPSARGRSCSSVSIPAWFDWRLDVKHYVPLITYVSIPAWFDWRRKNFSFRSSRNQVSIPAWFDWRLMLKITCAADSLVSIPAWFDWRQRRL